MKKAMTGILISYAAVYIVWGSTYYAIRLAVDTLPAFWVLAMRFLFAGLVFLALAALTGGLKKLPTWRNTGASVLQGTLLLLVGNGMVTVAEKHVESYLAALVVSCTPFAVAFFDRILFKRRISLVRLGGIALGVAGVAVLLFDGKSFSFHWQPALLLVFVALASWSFSTSISQKLPFHENLLVSSGIQMTWVGLASALISLVFYKPLPQILPAVSAVSWWALVYLAVAGGATFFAFNYLLKHEPPIRVASYSIVNPGIAVLLGLALGNEKPLPLLFAGLPFILAGIGLMFYGEKLVQALKRGRDSRVPAAERE